MFSLFIYIFSGLLRCARKNGQKDLIFMFFLDCRGASAPRRNGWGVGVIAFCFGGGRIPLPKTREMMMLFQCDCLV